MSQHGMGRVWPISGASFYLALAAGLLRLLRVATAFFHSLFLSLVWKCTAYKPQVAVRSLLATLAMDRA